MLGKYGGKVLTIYITPTGVRVAEGENKNGSPYVARYFTVFGVEDFFTEIPGAPGNYEVTNMAGLVDAIVNECRNQKASCRRVMVCSNCFGIETSVVTESSKGSLKGALTGDIGSLFKAKKDKDRKNRTSLAPDKMSCKVLWGELVEDGTVSKKTTESTGDKFMLKSLVQEFYKRGYEVISIADCIGILINFRHTEEATFDSQGKIVINFDGDCVVLSMKKDLPVDITRYQPMTEDEILERVDGIVGECLEKVGRNPKVYLTGALMSNTYLYNALIDRLETVSCRVYDLFDRPQAEPDGTIKAFTADYSANIAMFMSAYAKNIVTILPAIEFSEVFRKNSKAIASIFLVISVLALGVTGFLAGSRFLALREMQNSPPQTASLEAQIQNLQSNQASLQSTIDTLTQADVTVLDLMNFVTKNESPMVTIVSIDTLDMLPPSLSVGLIEDTTVVAEDTTAGTEEVITGGGGGVGAERMPIILRGYARSAPAAVGYFDRLFNLGLPVDPVLNGIEKYELPNGDIVHIFEIQIGGDDA